MNDSIGYRLAVLCWQFSVGGSQFSVYGYQLAVFRFDFVKLDGKHSEDLASHIVSLNDFMEYYNYNRYPCRLYGKTPMQIVEGEDIDKKLFTAQLEKAKLERLEVNQNFNACIAGIECKVP